MSFKKYASIENAHRQKHIEACHQLGNPDWVALEKIHGSNFGFIVEGDVVTPFKRSSSIGWNPVSEEYEFMNCDNVVNRYHDHVLHLREKMGQDIQVYGELYGEGIQRNSNYGRKDFIVFDILLMEDDVFLSWDMLVCLCNDASIPHVIEVGRGTLEDMLDIPVDAVYSPQAQANGKEMLWEGVVIKQRKNEVFLNSGSRAIIKNKSSTFSEKGKGGKAAKKPYKLTDELMPLYESFCAYVNQNRLDSVLSKEGKVEQKDFGKVAGLLVQDAKEDYVKDNGEIEKDDWKAIAKGIKRHAENEVRYDWLNILDRGDD